MVRPSNEAFALQHLPRNDPMNSFRLVALASLSLLPVAAGCLDDGTAGLGDPVAAEARELGGGACALPALGQGNVCELENGSLEYRVTLPSGERYVEVFARQNGVQNLAQAITGFGVDHGDGTTTYVYARPGYAASDRVEYRFYSYLPDAPGVFTPGPAEQLWYSRSAPPVTHVTHVAVAKDAAVVYSSYATGPSADRNFGGATTVDIGEYHLTSEGLFGYSLAGVLPAGAVVTKAELVVAASYAPGGPIVSMKVGRVLGAWSEASVTWNTKPAYAYVGEQKITGGVESRVDVTSIVQAALADGASDVSVVLAPSQQAPSTDNLFIDAREKSGGQPTFLALEWQ
jgi:hypothetical protein